MAEIRRSGTWGSALTSDEFAAIRSVGFEPVGQVLGAAVYNIGYTGGYNCPGAWGAWRGSRLRVATPEQAVHLRSVRAGLHQADHEGLGARRARARHLDRVSAR